MINEEWRPVVGWDGFYEVSSLGQVKSVTRRITKSDGSRPCFGGRVMKPFLNTAGYPVVRLSDAASGRRSVARVHRLVASAFLPNPDNLPEVNHKDGVKTNYALGNLEWTTAQGNRKHAWDTGLRTRAHLPILRGTEKDNAKLDEAAVRHIRAVYAAEGRPLTALALKYGVSKKTILRVVKGDAWAHVSLPGAPDAARTALAGVTAPSTEGAER